MTSQNGFTAATLNDRIDSLVSNLKSVAEHLSTAASSVKDKATEAKSHAASRAGSIATRAGKTVQAHPIAAIGVALGVGYLVMRLMRR